MPVTLSQDALERVAGTYQVPGEASQQVSIGFSEGRLVVSFSGQDAGELVPESETTFFFRRTGSTLQVEVEDDRANAVVVGAFRAERVD